MMKKKPREIVILPLMKQTYSARRDYITSPDRISVQEILERYPALKIPACVSVFYMYIVLVVPFNPYFTCQFCFWLVN